MADVVRLATLSGTTPLSGVATIDPSRRPLLVSRTIASKVAELATPPTCRGSSPPSSPAVLATGAGHLHLGKKSFQHFCVAADCFRQLFPRVSDWSNFARYKILAFSRRRILAFTACRTYSRLLGPHSPTSSLSSLCALRRLSGSIEGLWRRPQKGFLYVLFLYSSHKSVPGQFHS